MCSIHIEASKRKVRGETEKNEEIKRDKELSDFQTR